MTLLQKIFKEDDKLSYIERMLFTGKVVLVTGASSGIGKATAIEFALLGADLALTGRNVEKLKKVASECQKANQKFSFIVTGELVNEGNTKAILDKTIEYYGRLDVLVNNAGILGVGGIENASLKQYDQIMNVNMRSVYHLTTLAVPHLVKSKGNIVNVSSIAGLRSIPSLLVYCVSKSALDQFTRCIALELAPKQVRVNSVNPGVIDTEIFRNFGYTEEENKAILNRAEGYHALGRAGRSEEVAKTITYLASDHASFVTGVTIPVDGGRHAMCAQ